jgi:hypothetical protein
MDGKLNIKSILPIFGSPIKVKGPGQKKQDSRDRSFDRHLKKDGGKAKRENPEARKQHDTNVNKQNDKSSVEVETDEGIGLHDEDSLIDILA